MKIKREKTALFLILLFFVWSVVGCSSLIKTKDSNSLNPISKEIKKMIDISNELPKFTKIKEDDNETQWIVKHKKEKLLKFKYMKSEEENKNNHLIFIYNILKDKKQIVSNLIADALLDEGFDCIIVQQEYFMNENWARPIFKHPSNTKLSYDEYTANLMRNVGRIIKYWIPRQSKLTGEYGFVGISMGGIHSTMSAALFPKSKMTVAVMAGGGNVELFKNSTEKLVISNRENLSLDYKANYPNRDIYKDLSSLKFKILDLAKSVDTKKIKLMITKYDSTVPTKCQWNLYEALGKPETRTYPCGHYTLGIFYFSVKWQIQNWMTEAFSD